MNKDQITKVANRMLVVLNLLILFYLSIIYYIDLSNGIANRLQVFIIMSIVIVGVSICLIKYIKDNTDYSFRYYSMIVSSIAYAIGLLNSDRMIVFCFIFPIISMYVLLFEEKVLKVISGVFIGINIIRIIQLSTIYGYVESEDIILYGIQMLCVVVFCIAIIRTIKISNQLNKMYLQKILDEKKYTENILKNIIMQTEIIEDKCNDGYKCVKRVDSSIEDLMLKSEDVVTNANDTERAVDQQIILTNDINTDICKSGELSDLMQKSTQRNIKIVEESVEKIHKLNEVNLQVKSHSEISFDAILDLAKKIEEILQVASFIEDVAGQTQLLSFNSHIESARLGEQGRGFLVISNEMRNLSGKIEESSKEIRSNIYNIERQIKLTLQESNKLEEIQNEQSDIIKSIRIDFSNIESSSVSLYKDIEEVVESVEKITKANQSVLEGGNDVKEIAKLNRYTTEINNDTCNNVNQYSKEMFNIMQELIEANKAIKQYT